MPATVAVPASAGTSLEGIYVTDLDRLLAAIKKQWEQTTDPAKRASLHQQAEQLRKAGASEAVANILAYGSAFGKEGSVRPSYMPESYSVVEDLARRLRSGTEQQTQQKQQAQQKQPDWLDRYIASQIRPLPLNIQDVLSRFSEQLRQYTLPYEQALRDLLARAPAYTPLPESELRHLAQEYAELQIGPQREALRRALQEAERQAEPQRQAIEAAYAAVPAQMSRLLEEARQKALESAIARGGGRSGLVEWLTAELQKPVVERAQQLEAEKAAKLADVESALALARRQAAEQEQQLAERLGQLASQQLAALRDLEYARMTGDWERAWNALMALANAATQAEQFKQTYAFNLLPYFALTEEQRQQLPLYWAQVIGEVPATLPQPVGALPPMPEGAAGTPYELLPLRAYAASVGRGHLVDWDPTTGEVIIAGRRYTQRDIERMGGKIVNGITYLPRYILDRLLGG